MLIKIISQLLLPPGILILLAAVGLLCWRHRWGRGMVWVALLLLWGLSTEPVRDLLLAPLENRYAPFRLEALQAGEANPPTAIVLLGSGIHQASPAYGGRDSLPRAAMLRTLYAAYLAQQTGLPIFAAGGRVLRQHGESEAAVMKRVLVEQLRLSADRVWMESDSNNTWENGEQMAKRFAAAGRAPRIVLVTSAWHMPRAVAAFEANGFSVLPAPCDYLVEQKPYDLRSYLPSSGVLSDASDALHEYLGLIWFSIRYGA